MSLFVDTGEIDPTKDYFPELVGEGKKYKTQVELARAAVEKDLHIKQLEAETKSVRDTLAERVKLEELLDKINSIANKPPSNEPAPQGVNGTVPPAPVGLTPEQIDERLNKRISEIEQAQKAKANEALVKEKLVQKFGNNYSSRLKEEATKLQMTVEQLDQVAATNPAAFLRLVGAEDSKQVNNTLFTPPTGVTQTFVPTPNDRTESWYKALRKSNPVLHDSRDMQIQQHKDAQRLGESFFDA